MIHQLSSNIRALRKKRKLTQEQLAEAMNVTVGAVSKWELGQSLPEINMLINLADFFDSSVDALLGYDLYMDSQDAIAKKLKVFRDAKDFEAGKNEFEKVYQKYPNSFVIVFQGAKIYNLYGIETRDEKVLKRGIELLKRAISLIDQNTDPEISETTLYIQIAESYMSLGNADKGLDILKEHNPNGINDSLIGMIYATTNQPNEALVHLSDAFLSCLCEQIRISVGYLNAFGNKKDYTSAINIMRFQEEVLNSLNTLNATTSPTFFAKMEAVLFAATAMMYYFSDQKEMAKTYLIKAKNVALQFDTNPCYTCNNLKYYYGTKPATVYDDMGETAMHAIEKVFLDEEIPQGLIDLWKEVLSDEETVYKTIL
jgi:transcriptional regulator with XRE-family HTH domain